MQEMKQNEGAKITLSVEARNTLFFDVYQRNHIEACGLLLGYIDEYGNWNITHAVPLRNIAASPVYFEFAPEDLLEAELAHPGHIVGVYHSHPTGFAKASEIDRQNMQRVNQEQEIPWAWLIICGPFNESSVQRSQGQLHDESLIAYHHYRGRGLERLGIRYEVVEARDQ